MKFIPTNCSLSVFITRIQYNNNSGILAVEFNAYSRFIIITTDPSWVLPITWKTMSPKDVAEVQHLDELIQQSRIDFRRRNLLFCFEYMRQQQHLMATFTQLESWLRMDPIHDLFCHLNQAMEQVVLRENHMAMEWIPPHEDLPNIMYVTIFHAEKANDMLRNIIESIASHYAPLFEMKITFIDGPSSLEFAITPMEIESESSPWWKKWLCCCYRYRRQFI